MRPYLYSPCAWRALEPRLGDFRGPYPRIGLEALPCPCRFVPHGLLGHHGPGYRPMRVAIRRCGFPQKGDRDDGQKTVTPTVTTRKALLVKDSRAE